MPGEWRRWWGRWRGLTREERWLVVEAWLLLPIMALGLKAAGFGRVHRWLGGSALRPAEASNPQFSAQATAAVVDGVTRRHPCHPTCLTRSLALLWLLRRRGIAAELRVGVRKEGGGLQAHAWVEHQGHVLGEAGDVGARFAALERAEVGG